MNITRRTALLGAAGGMIGGLPVAASTPTLSPFLRVYDGSATMWRVDPTSLPPLFDPDRLSQYYSGKAIGWQSPAPTPRFEIVTVTPADGIAVASMEDAEDQMLKMIPAPTCFARIPSDPKRHIWCGDGLLSLPIAINRGSNLVCSRTRSKVADTILMSPESFTTILSDYYANGGGAFYSLPEPQTIGRWTHVARLNYALDIFVGEHAVLQDDHVIVMQAAENNHAVLIRSPTGLHLVMDPSPVRAYLTAGPSQDFFFSIGVDRI